MGDFNATLRDKSMKPLVSQGFLKPLTPDKQRPLSGTYRYKGDWSWIDHMLVSDGLLMMNRETKPIVKLYTQSWMQRPMNDGTWYPCRTYLGATYNGGVSDHVPIYCDLKW
jgi:endonuclease/exonuclease/phosphatase family metal-dependent hydrolase